MRTSFLQVDRRFVRHFFCIVLMLILPLHGFSAVHGTVPASATAFEVEHELDHLYGVSHHHGDDGSIQYDDSSESSQHHSEHAGSGQPSALPFFESLKIALLVRPLLHTEPSVFVPDPVLERPPRPPQTSG